MIRAFVLALSLSSPTLSLAQEGDPVTEFASDDAAMAAAQQTAQDTLPMFLTNSTDDEGYSVAGAAVKIAIFIDDAQSEVIWVSPFTLDFGQGMIGLLANQPNFIDGLNAGDRVEFNSNMVRDWSYTSSDGKLYGNYTTRVMVPMLDAETAANITAALSEEPVPADWE